MSVRASNLYPATFTEVEVINKGATVTLTNGEFVAIGEYTVKADELVGMGKGGYGDQASAIGRLYAKFMDSESTPGAITAGKFRIELMSSQDMPLGQKPIYIDVDLAALSAGATAITDRFVFPFEGTLLSQDKKFVFKIKNTSGSNVTLSKANSTVLMDITRALI